MYLCCGASILSMLIQPTDMPSIFTNTHTHTHIHAHAVILLGGLNSRLRMHPDEAIRRMAASAAECQSRVAAAAGVGGKAPSALLPSLGGWRCVVLTDHGGENRWMACSFLFATRNQITCDIPTNTSGLLHQRLWAGADSRAYEHGLDDARLESLQEVQSGRDRQCALSHMLL